MSVVRFLILAFGIVGIDCGVATAGSFYNPLGDPGLEQKGAEGAARLNEALASVHLMYAALERKDASVNERKKNAVDQLSSSLELFKTVRDLAGDKPISLRGRNETEQESINHFLRVTLTELKLPQPKTQMDLANVAVTIVSNFEILLDKTRLDPKSGDFTVVRQIIRAEISLEEVGLASSLIYADSSPLFRTN
jgi:hypothetical protein